MPILFGADVRLYCLTEWNREASSSQRCLKKAQRAIAQSWKQRRKGGISLAIDRLFISLNTIFLNDRMESDLHATTNLTRRQSAVAAQTQPIAELSAAKQNNRLSTLIHALDNA